MSENIALNEIFVNENSQAKSSEVIDFIKKKWNDQLVETLPVEVSAPITESPENDSSIEEMDFPDGGRQAWLAVLGSFLGLVNCFGLANCSSAIEAYIAHHQLAGMSASSIGWVFSIYVFVSLTFGVFAGHWFDTKGPRLPIALGAVLTFVGLFAMGSCTHIYQFILSFGVVTGLGTAVQMSSLVGITSHYFYKKRGLATGLASVGGSAGGVVFPIMLRKLYEERGFAWAMRILAVIVTVCDVLALILIKPRFPPKPSPASYQPEAPLWQKVAKFLSDRSDFGALKDMRFLTCTLAIACSELFLFCATTYYGSYAIQQGNSETTAYTLITLMNASGVFARAAAGYWSDTFGKFNTMTVMGFFASLFCLIVWLPFGNKPAGLYSFSVLYGFTLASVLSLSPICLAQISRVEDFGKRYSTCYFVVAFVCLVGIPLSGLLITDTGRPSHDFNRFIIFSSMIGFLGTVFWVISRYFAVRLKLQVY